jgi:hypothetical protein
MFSQDYIMRQIQQMTQVLNAILTQVLKLKKQEQEIEIASITNEMLTEELGLSLDDLFLFLEEKRITSLKKEYGFTNEHLGILADLLYELAESRFDKPDQNEESLSFFSKSLKLYEFIELDERIYSIDRNLKITKIKDYLS